MPQLNKGGKFVFGKSLVREDGSLCLPPQAVEEYDICCEGRVYLFTGAKATGGFCVTRKGLLLPSKLSPIRVGIGELGGYNNTPGGVGGGKGRSDSCGGVSPEGRLKLTGSMLERQKIAPGDELMCIRSSDIAFTLGHHGPLLERAENYRGEIPVY